MFAKVMWIYLAIGILCLAGGATTLFVVKRFIETVVFIRAAARTPGKVIYNAPARNSDGHLTYLPVFEYRTNDGSVYQHTSGVASTPPAYRVGETVTLLYQRKNPRNAKVDSFSELWLTNLIVAVIGLIFFAAAIIVFFVAAK